MGGRTLYRLLARDAGGETEGVLLNETVPAWVVDIVVEKKLPKFIKVTFFVLPHPTLGYKTFKRERLIANDFLQIRKVGTRSRMSFRNTAIYANMFSSKVIEHVYEKVMNGGSEGGSGAATPTGEGRSHGEPGKKRNEKYLQSSKNILILRWAARGRERRGGAGGAAVQRHDAGPQHGPQDGQALHLEVGVGPGASLQTPQIETRRLHSIYSS